MNSEIPRIIPGPRLSDVSERSREHSPSTESSTSEHEYGLTDVVVVAHEPSVVQLAHEPSQPSPSMPSQPSQPSPSMPSHPTPSITESPFARHAAFAAYRAHMSRAASAQSAPSMQSAQSIPPDADPATFVVNSALADAVPATRNKSLLARSLERVNRKAIAKSLRVSIDVPDTLRPSDTIVGGRIVKKRRRLPLKFIILFGLVSCICLAVGLTTLAIGIYNLTKLRASRATKTIDAFAAEITPRIEAIAAAVGAGARRLLRK